MITGGISAPHHLAIRAGERILRLGGNAIEAMIATAATCAVVYPHMNGLGGDGFWLILEPGSTPQSIGACGTAGLHVTPDHYLQSGLSSLPTRGPLAANTVAGAVSGWDALLTLSRRLGGQLSLDTLLDDAIAHAEQGYAVSTGQSQLDQDKLLELRPYAGFAEAFLVNGNPPQSSTLFRQPRLSITLQRLARDGLDSFYCGALAHDIAHDLQRMGSLLTAQDLEQHRTFPIRVLGMAHDSGQLSNLSFPTKGLVSLAILGIAERAGLADVEPNSADHIHLLVEASKLAFVWRDRFITDPRHTTLDPQSLLTEKILQRLAQRIDRAHASPWGKGSGPGPADTVWLGATDPSGLTVSGIQSLYHEYGSGLVLPRTGLLWQNRGAAFSLNPESPRYLEPGKLPFHTLNPALAQLKDGRIMAYGTMGGEGQPQTQAAIFSRYALFDIPLAEAIAMPRWLLGRTWGQSSNNLKLEHGIDLRVAHILAARGHILEWLPSRDLAFGHAGAVLRHPTGAVEAVSDPRSDAYPA